jgi:hypothetical protein
LVLFTFSLLLKEHLSKHFLAIIWDQTRLQQLITVKPVSCPVSCPESLGERLGPSQWTGWGWGWPNVENGETFWSGPTAVTGKSRTAFCIPPASLSFLTTNCDEEVSYG